MRRKSEGGQKFLPPPTPFLFARPSDKISEFSVRIFPEIRSDFVQGAEQLNQWRNRVGGLTADFPEFSITLKGLIDDLLISPDGRYIPFDFKSRGYPIKEDTHTLYKNQLDLYALLFEKNNLPPADYGYLLFFYPTSYTEGTAKFETELVKMEVSPKRGYEVLRKVHQIITGPAPQSHTDCKYCQYRSFQLND